jgi:TRAP-type C4-dicarboxylate transport system permease small subunit
MFVQVVFRYIFNSSLAWSEELVRYLFVWLTFWGGSLAFKNRMHIGIDFFIDLLPQKYFKTIQIFNLTLVIIFQFFLIIIGFAWVYKGHGLLSSALSLPVNILLYSALPLTSVLTVIYGVGRVKDEVSKIREK